MTRPPVPAHTVSHVFGELVWLFTQSSRHAALPVAELAWLLMPAIAARQYHLFRDDDRPVGAAIWASVDAAGERALIEGRFQPPHVSGMAWTAGDRLWLTELIAPFATDANKQADVMFGDLVTGVFKGRAFKMLHIDPLSGDRRVIPVDGDTGDRLSHYLAAQMR